MAVQIQLRNDTAANWTAANPVLAAGEMGVETDTDQLKLGNGIDTWTALPYGGLRGSDGADGAPGVVSATSPIQYNPETQTVSIDQSSISIAQSQVTNLTADLSTKANAADVVSRTNGTVTTASTSSTVVRNITLSTSDPSGGADGDVWLKYTP
jgi:hypothetical protein